MLGIGHERFIGGPFLVGDDVRHVLVEPLLVGRRLSGRFPCCTGAICGCGCCSRAAAICVTGARRGRVCAAAAGVQDSTGAAEASGATRLATGAADACGFGAGVVCQAANPAAVARVKAIADASGANPTRERSGISRMRRMRFTRLPPVAASASSLRRIGSVPMRPARRRTAAHRRLRLPRDRRSSFRVPRG